MLSRRNETHIRPADPESPAAEHKTTDLVSPLYTVRWGSMQNVLADEVSVVATMQYETEPKERTRQCC
jgi:hypothetical protein